MYTNEIDAINDIKERINKANEREYEIFISERSFPRAGEYIATIIARVAPKDTNAQTLSKEFLQLFITGAEVRPIRSYITIITHNTKEFRTVDFVLEAIISLE
jgi:hypothetical protein